MSWGVNLLFKFSTDFSAGGLGTGFAFISLGGFGTGGGAAGGPLLGICMDGKYMNKVYALSAAEFKSYLAGIYNLTF